jgi:multiple sugar transport system ATP-binding protein
MNLLKGVVQHVNADGLDITLAGGTVIQALVDSSTAKVGDAVTVGIRAEHLMEDSYSGIPLNGVVNLVEHLGEANYLYLTLANGSDIVVRGDGEREVKLGTPITISAPSNAFHVFNADGQALRRLKPGNMQSSRHKA